MSDVLSGATAILAVISATVIGLYVGYRFLTRNRIELSEIQFIDVDTTQVPPPDEIRRRINTRIDSITTIHRPLGTLDAEGEADSISQVQLANEAIETSVGLLSEVSHIPFIGFAFRLLDLILPRIALDAEVKGDGDVLRVSARLRRGSRTLDTLGAEIERNRADTVDRLVDQIAYELIVVSGSNQRIRRTKRVGTGDWRAFRALTEALEIIETEPAIYSLEGSGVAGHVLMLLDEAIDQDPRYARAHYNKGAVLYNLYVGVEDNLRARTYFEDAIKLLEGEDLDDRQRTLLSMCYVGQSRCYSQMVHRFGRGQHEAELARDAARRALELSPDEQASLYAMGFAWHCTEELDDIERGRQYYERIIEKHPRTYAVVHNNYGYILLEKAKILQRESRNAEANDALDEAIHQLNEALASSPSPRIQDFAYSNRGKANRLLGKYEAAVNDAQRALKYQQETSRYTGGLEDLSETYLAWRLHDEALEAHSAALRSTPDVEHRHKLADRFRSEMTSAGMVPPDRLPLGTDEQIGQWIDELATTLPDQTPS